MAFIGENWIHVREWSNLRISMMRTRIVPPKTLPVYGQNVVLVYWSSTRIQMINSYFVVS
jgi:hypothetical protein